MRQISASERRGILIIAGLAFAVTGAGLIVAHCDRRPTALESGEVELLYRSGRVGEKADSLSKSIGNEGRQRAGKRKADTNRSGKPKKEPKTYRRRSRLDEPAQ